MQAQAPWPAGNASLTQPKATLAHGDRISCGHATPPKATLTRFSGESPQADEPSPTLGRGKLPAVVPNTPQHVLTSHDTALGKEFLQTSNLTKSSKKATLAHFEAQAESELQEIKRISCTHTAPPKATLARFGARIPRRSRRRRPLWGQGKLPAVVSPARPRCRRNPRWWCLLAARPLPTLG